jgi:hypothetical protein
MDEFAKSKYGSRKYHLALLVLLIMFALALADKLTATAATGLIAAAGIYCHYNTKQKREQLAESVVSVLTP